jgi:hypothetical protein
LFLSDDPILERENLVKAILRRIKFNSIQFQKTARIENKVPHLSVRFRFDSLNIGRYGGDRAKWTELTSFLILSDTRLTNLLNLVYSLWKRMP